MIYQINHVRHCIMQILRYNIKEEWVVDPRNGIAINLYDQLFNINDYVYGDAAGMFLSEL